MFKLLHNLDKPCASAVSALLASSGCQARAPWRANLVQIVHLFSSHRANNLLAWSGELQAKPCACPIFLSAQLTLPDILQVIKKLQQRCIVCGINGIRWVIGAPTGLAGTSGIHLA